MRAPWAAGKVEAQALQWEGKRTSVFEARKWGLLIHSLKSVSAYSKYAYTHIYIFFQEAKDYKEEIKVVFKKVT